MSHHHSTTAAFRNRRYCAGDASDAADQHFRRNLDKLYPLGPRIFAEILGHLGATSFRQTEIEQLVARFADQEPETLCALCADHWPPRPDLRIVGGRHHD